MRAVSALTRMSTRRARAALALAAGVTSLAVPGGAAAGDRQTYEARFTADRPGVATGLELEIDYVNPSDPAGKPPAVAEIVIRLPRGARIDTSVPPSCGASEPQLMLFGPGACPAASRVGDGALSADVGPGLPSLGEFQVLPRVIETQGTFFNGEGDLLFVAETTNTAAPLRIASRFAVGKRSFTSAPPPLPGLPPPDPYLAIDEVANSLDPIAGEAEGSGYITTPARCGKGGRWRFRARFSYRDGVVERERARMDCRS